MARRSARVAVRPSHVHPHRLLQLMWLASPALPVGGFSYSEGLEAAVDAGVVRDESSARNWLLDQMALSLARTDLPVAGAAHRAWQRRIGGADIERLAELNDWVHQTRESSELRQQTQQMGRSLVEWLRTRDADAVSLGETADPRLAQNAALHDGPTWPVAFALAAARVGCSDHEALSALGFGWCENQVQAALKAVPLGQSAGQRILAALAGALPPVIDAALALPDSARQAFTPMLAILSAQHEAQYSRLFRS